VDPFVLALLAALLGFLGWALVLARRTPIGGGRPLGLPGAVEIARRSEELEAEDLRQMMALHNRRRAARGQPAISAEAYELSVLAESAEQRRCDREQQEQALAREELRQLLEATNARRRARGLPQRTLEDAAREFGRP